MPPIPQKAQTEDSPTFDPDTFFSAWSKEAIGPPANDDFRQCILQSFDLPTDDDYTYVAVAQVNLQQAQKFVELGGQGPLHTWYKDAQGTARPNPTQNDITAYIDIFRATTHTTKALTALSSNAKKDSLRADIAKHLLSKYKPHPSIQVSKNKTHINPYLDVWAWSCRNLEWGGPDETTARIRTAHPILPVLYHHFGCVVPSYESLVAIQTLSRGRRVLDVGSGNGYWCYMLRRLEALPGSKDKRRMEVLPIDNGMSEWRTVWVGDTLQTDGVQWLAKNEGGKDDVLLLVYPVVGQEFTSKIIKAFKGTTIISAGAQNASGYTGFAKETLAEWMAREMPEWEQTLQIPLPSFAGKDEALFAFERKGQA